MEIRTPNPSFSGRRAGVDFSQGRASVDRLNEKQRRFFARHGYRIDDVVDADDSDGDDVDGVRRPTRRDSRNLWEAYATFLGLSAEGTKADIIAAVEAHEAVADSDADEPEDSSDAESEEPDGAE